MFAIDALTDVCFPSTWDFEANGSVGFGWVWVSIAFFWFYSSYWWSSLKHDIANIYFLNYIASAGCFSVLLFLYVQYIPLVIYYGPQVNYLIKVFHCLLPGITVQMLYFNKITFSQYNFTSSITLPVDILSDSFSVVTFLKSIPYFFTDGISASKFDFVNSGKDVSAGVRVKN